MKFEAFQDEGNRHHLGYFTLGRELKPFEWTTNKDLTDEQQLLTQMSYAYGALAYLSAFERRLGVAEQVWQNTLYPFLQLVEQYCDGKETLFVGCGTGRDMEEAVKQGHLPTGLDSSPKMLAYAKQYLLAVGYQAPLFLLNLLSINDETIPNAYDGIFCESAIAHVPKKDAPEVIENLGQRTKNNGVGLIVFRESKEGLVYKTEDPVGIRYYTSYSEEQAEKILAKSPYEVLKQTRNPHIVEGRPPFLNYFVKKRIT